MTAPTFQYHKYRLAFTPTDFGMSVWVEVITIVVRASCDADAMLMAKSSLATQLRPKGEWKIIRKWRENDNDLRSTKVHG